MDPEVEVCIQIFSPGSIPGDVDVDFSTRDGSAMGETPLNDTWLLNWLLYPTADFDFIGIPNRVLTFPAGSQTGNSMCVDIGIINDNDLELGGENFFADIESNDADTIPDEATINLQETNDDS